MNISHLQLKQVAPVTQEQITRGLKTGKLKEASTEGFIQTGKGVYFVCGDEKEWICSPLKILAMTHNEDNIDWGRVLEFPDPDGCIHRIAIPQALHKSDGAELRGRLLSHGLIMANSRRAKNHLSTYIQSTPIENRMDAVTQMGWHQGVFVLPHTVIGHHSLIYQPRVNIPTAMTRSGTLANWQKHIGQYCIGNAYMQFVVSMAFAAPLLKLGGQESGGIHLMGVSSIGKTTLLQLAASICGSPAYLKRWRATSNGLEALAHVHNDSLLILDELSQIDPKEAGEVAYMLSNGMGKQRANTDGDACQATSWRLLWLSAGETSLAQHMALSGKTIRAGQSVRFVDLLITKAFENTHDLPSSEHFVAQLKQHTSAYYGEPLRAFLTYLVDLQAKDPLYVNTLIQAHQAALMETLPQHSDGQVKRVAQRFALIATGGEMATAANITGWQPGEAKAAAQKALADWIAQRGGVDNQEKHMILRQVRYFFEQYGESRFTLCDAEQTNATPRPTHQRAGFRVEKKNDLIFYVLPEVFRQELCLGFQPQQVAKICIEAGWLIPGENNKKASIVRLPKHNKVCRLYHFSSAVISMMNDPNKQTSQR